MALITKAPRGTHDILPGEIHKWQHVEQVISEVFSTFGYREIRLPTFEHTELFERGVGDTTDVVQKEMYTFEDKGGRSITLRPEGTSPVVRAVLENGLDKGALPLRTAYFLSCFRYEKPQAGRLREFHQFGIEMFGTATADADTEVILVADAVFKRFGIRNLTLTLNSIGCPTCRKEYHAALKAYFAGHVEELCETCRDRLERNPMRILDCKSPVCHEIAKGAPVILDYLCDECREHFDAVKRNLDALGIPYRVDPTIVRGLDYYSKTVFEFVSNEIGAQGTVCGGGRYDGLIPILGGDPLPGIGFGMGLERLLLTLEAAGYAFPSPEGPAVYIGNIGEPAGVCALELVTQLRQAGIAAEKDIVGRSLKAQMKYADKIGAKYTLILGDSELESRRAKLKDMATGESVEIDLDQIVTEMTNRR
ncbi:histidine--tRNA ligase [Feifania hominis]|uniref:Histidine--tRNA ligase n=1 Tax=Feifania hominis TaxID=2763660 RepID=A0A926DDG5_9FIRM|nr:histidine--tRNA ligase [Feifania hominis]MBC8536588.1 histidine--tRNA ligase [Feifania hominis]